MYKLFSGVSLLVRAYLCYKTIDNIPILANPLANELLGEIISLYIILMLLSRFTVGRFYESGEAPVLGTIYYFFVYIFYLIVTYGILIGLTKFGILPI